MILGLDFGASTVDLVQVNNGRLIKIRSFESLRFPKLKLDGFLKKIDLSRVAKIFVTGGKSRFFKDSYKGIPVIKVSEIEAIGRGAWWLAGKGIDSRRSLSSRSKGGNDKKDLLAISLGTGTCMVKVSILSNGNIKCTHIGGTGVGGGTFLGLSKLLIKVDNVEKLIEMFKKGNKSKVDLSVGEIVGSGLGLVKADDTASNLGKISSEIDFKKEDLAAGIVNLIGQTIATTVVFAAKANKCDLIVLGGKLTKIRQILDVILKVAKMHKIKAVVPHNSLYMSAIGAVSDNVFI
jgi:type II pantothenate kinase